MAPARGRLNSHPHSNSRTAHPHSNSRYTTSKPNSDSRSAHPTSTSYSYSYSYSYSALFTIVLAAAARRGAGERHVAAGAAHVCVVGPNATAGVTAGISCYGSSASAKLAAPRDGVWHGVAVGDDYSCGLATNGSLTCWGALPGLTTGVAGSMFSPPAGTLFIDVTGGARHVCGLAANGSVACYGDGASGATSPPAGWLFQGVSAGVGVTCGVARNHSVACWGNATNAVVAGAAAATAAADADHVVVGAAHACYVRVNGSVACWGANNTGQVSTTPSPAATAGTWWLTAGGGFTCAIAGGVQPGSVTCWGGVTAGVVPSRPLYEVSCAAWGCVAAAAAPAGLGAPWAASLFAATAPAAAAYNTIATAVAAATATLSLVVGDAGGFVDGIGTAVAFYLPYGIAVDADGTLYVSDSGNNRVRRVLPTGAVSTIGGNAQAGATDGAGTVATFNNPTGIALDGSGAVYVSNTASHTIRMLAGGVVTTVAGAGTAGFVDAAGTNAYLNVPRGLAWDARAGVLYIADMYNHRVRKLVPGGNVSTVAGNGDAATIDGTGTSASLYGPTAVAVDAAGNVYVAEMQGHAIRLITPAGVVSTLAGNGVPGYQDGVAAGVQFNAPAGVAVDSGGNVIVVEENNHRIRKVTPAGVVTTLAGTGSNTPRIDGTPSSATLYGPTGVAVDGLGNIFVAEKAGNVIRRLRAAPLVTLNVSLLAAGVAGAGDALLPWRATSANAQRVGVVDARGVPMPSVLSAVTTAGMNPAITSLALGTVTLTARAAGVGAANATFSTSAQRGITVLTLTTATLPSDALTLPNLATLTVASPVATLQLAPRAFGGTPALACINCAAGAATGVANLSSLGVTTATARGVAAFAATGVLALPRIQVLDASYNDIAAVAAGDFDGAATLQTLVLAHNNITVVSASAFTSAKQPALGAIDLAANPLAVNPVCAPGYAVEVRVLTGGARAIVCTTCAAGFYCPATATTTAGGVPCPPGWLCGVGASAPALCPPGFYCPPASAAGVPCPAGTLCGAGTATLAAAPPCPPGAMCPAAAPRPLACPAGWLCNAGDAAPTPCPAGFYCATNTSTATLAACPPGAYCPPGASAPVPCPAGAYCAAAAVTPATCPGGSYCSGNGSTPTPCPPGSYCPFAAATPVACPVGYACALAAAAPVPCPPHTIAGPSAAACLPCTASTYTLTAAAATCVPCTAGVAAATCDAPAITWRDTLTVVADGIGTWTNVSLALVEAATGHRTACAPVLRVSPVAVSCAVALLPAAAANASLVLALQVAATNATTGAATGWLPLGFNVTLSPPPPVAATLAATVTPWAGGSGRLLLQLPRARLTDGDWNATGAPPPAGGANATAVWLAGAPCSDVTYTSATTLSCAVPPVDGAHLSVLVALAGGFNLTGAIDGAFPPPALASTAAVGVALPPADAPWQTRNVTLRLSGTALCAGGVPRLRAVTIGGAPCGSVTCASSAGALTCAAWNASQAARTVAAAAPTNATVTLDVAARWGVDGAPLTCAGCVTATARPTLDAVAPASIAGAGTSLVLTGSGFMDATDAAPPSVFVGGVPCDSVVAAPAGHVNVLKCVAPTVPGTAPGYPVVAVTVVNAAGAASTDAATVTYPAAFTVAWAPGTLAAAPLVGLPSDASGGLVAPLTPVAVLYVTSREAAACTLTLNASAPCTPPAGAVARPAGVTVSPPPAGITVAASGTVTATLRVLPLNGTALAGAAGCRATLVATCVDAAGNVASTAVGGSGAQPVVALPTWSAAWLAPPPAPWTVAPTLLPPLAVVFTVAAAGALNLSATPWVTCTAVVVAATVTLPAAAPLSQLRPQSLVATAAAVLVAANATAATLQWDAIDVTGSDLGAALTVAAECTWTPSGEAVRLPSLPLAVVGATATLAPPASRDVDSYEPFTLAGAAVVTSPPGFNLTAAAGACSLVATPGAALQLSASAAAATWSVPADGALPLLNATVDGPPRQSVALSLACTLWGKAVPAGSGVTVTTVPYAVAAVDAAVRAVWPSGSGVTPAAPLTPSVAVAAPARTSLACSAAVDDASVACPSPPTGDSAWGVGLGIASTGVALAGASYATLALAPAATRATLSLPALGIHAAGGCVANVTVSCRDGSGRGGDAAPATPVVVGRLTASWVAATPAAFGVVPTVPLPPTTATVATVPRIPLPPLAAGNASALTCVAALFDAAAAVPVTTTLAATLAAGGAASPAVSGSVAPDAGSGGTGYAVTFGAVATDAAAFGTAYLLHAECTWTPSGERVRLPPLPAPTITVTVTVATGGGGGNDVVVLGYAPATLPLALLFTAPPLAAVALPATTATCSLTPVAAAQSSALEVAGWSVLVAPAALAAGAAAPLVTTAAAFSVAAAPNTSLPLRATCTVFGGTAASGVVAVRTAALAIAPAGALPHVFLPSDASAPAPVSPGVAVRVAVEGAAAPLADAACSLAAASSGAALVAVPAGAALTAVAANATTGVVAFPPFVVHTPLGTDAVRVTVSCLRRSGDAPPPLTFALDAVRLRMDVCVAPATASAMAVALPTFTFGVAVAAPGGAYDAPCAAGAAAVALPPISCAIALNASASSTNDTANVFLQHSAARADDAYRRASFDAFTLVAPQGQTYVLTVTCTMGALPLPEPYTFAVALAGCPPGQKSVSVTCVTCGDGAYSVGGVGATCTGCPPAGATCVAGILTLLPHYYRPPAHAGAPFGPTTELHPCYNAEACTLNASAAAYGCAPGYTGALCGVCDAAGGYAMFGQACATCWPPAASAAFLAVVLLLVVGVLARVALRTESGRSGASIVLRITLSYLQAVGALRVFKAGSTQAYASVMGWTEVVSASPLSVGALQCIARLPYLLQYVLTVALPALAAGAVVVLFVAVTTARAVALRPAPAFDAPTWRAALAAWWRSKRHLSTLVVVLFVTYMPITSASLRALDCIAPVDGVRYLRSDLSVPCGVGQHAAARALAYVVLVVVGLGFPAGLAWMLGTATQGQLLDDAFHGTWGFLFDGYRAPQLVASGDKAPAADAAAPALTTRRARPRVVASAADGDGNSGGGGRRRSTLLPGRLTQTWRVEGDSRVWWEALVLARKAGVVLLAVLVTNPYLQCVGASLWFGTFLLLQLRYAPYASPLYNRLETASLGASVVTAIISTALLQYNVGVSAADLHPPADMTPVEWAVTVLLVAINVVTFAVLAGTWLRLQCARAHGSLVKLAAVRARSSSSGRAEAQGTPTLTANPLRHGAVVTGVTRSAVVLRLPEVAAAVDPPAPVTAGAAAAIAGGAGGGGERVLHPALTFGAGASVAAPLVVVPVSDAAATAAFTTATAPAAPAATAPGPATAATLAPAPAPAQSRVLSFAATPVSRPRAARSRGPVVGSAAVP